MNRQGTASAERHTSANATQQKENRPAGPWGEVLVNPS